MINSEPDHIMNNCIEQYNQIKKSNLAVNNFYKNSVFSVHHSYLYNRLLHGSFFRHKAALPRVSFNNFNNDNQFSDNIKKINRLGIPYMLFHLPVKFDIEKKQVILNGTQKLLMDSLEKITEKQIIFLHREITKNTVPKVINLEPYDGHPNFDGLNLYAKTIGDYLIRNSLLQKKSE